MSKNILLVEGVGDKEFFESLLKVLSLGEIGITPIELQTPKDAGAEKDGKEHAIKTALTLHLKNLADKNQSKKCIGMILDADYNNSDPGNDWGYKQTVASVFKRISPLGYLAPSSQESGLVFQNDKGLSPFGLWVMSKDGVEGMFEDWLKTALVTSDSEETLFKHALQAVATLPRRKFKDIHQSKAEIETWLAWQTAPSAGLKSVWSTKDKDGNVIPPLINLESAAIIAMKTWLETLFTEKGTQQ